MNITLFLAFLSFGETRIVWISGEMLADSCSFLLSLQYLGGWYEMYRFPAVFESGQICNTANYTLKADGHIKVDNQGYK